VDPKALDGIVAAAGLQPDDVVVEVGPGAGFLTARLLQTGARVVAIEVDPVMVALLREHLGEPERLEVVNGDVLETDIAPLLARAGVNRCVVVGNLPYHITTPALFSLLPERRRIDRMVFTVQREVGARMAAGPGSKTYGALSVAIAYAAQCERLFGVGAGSFVPRPKVDSVVVRLTPVPARLDPAAEARLFSLVRASFGQRRKMLSNAVAEVAGGKEEARAMLERAGIDGRRRGETLTLDEFISLVQAGGMNP